MTDQTFLLAKISDAGTQEFAAGQDCVPWWSFTKTVVAAAALKLVDKGACELDAPFGEKPFTLRQLLQHQAGVPNYGGLAAYHDAVRNGERPWRVSELLDRVNAECLDFEPGTGWRYSNVGYLYVRQFIENVTGQDLGTALRNLVLKDLRLASVSFATQPDDLIATAWGNDRGYDPGWVYHGLLVGTPADAARFLHSLMTGKVLPSTLLDEMTASYPIGTQPLPGRPWQTTGYGLGLMIGRMENAGLAIGHSGVGPGSVGAVYHFPQCASPCTVAAFAAGEDEGRVEYEAVRLAQG